MQIMVDISYSEDGVYVVYRCQCTYCVQITMQLMCTYCVQMTEYILNTDTYDSTWILYDVSMDILARNKCRLLTELMMYILYTDAGVKIVYSCRCTLFVYR